MQIKRTLLQITAWGMILCASAYFAGFGSRIPGLTLGIVTSMLFFLILCYQLSKCVTVRVEKAMFYMKVGGFIRLCLVALMLLLSLKIKLFDVLSAVIGLFSFQVVIYANGMIMVVKSFYSPSK